MPLKNILLVVLMFAASITFTIASTVFIFKWLAYLEVQANAEQYQAFVDSYCIEDASIPTGAFYVRYDSTTAVFLEREERTEVVRVCE